MLLRLRKGMKRLDRISRQPEHAPGERHDFAWRNMLERLDRKAEGERRLAAAESALNRLR